MITEFLEKISNPVFQSNFLEVLSFFAIAFLISFLVTPVIIKISRLCNIVDLPKELRSEDDKTASRRIHRGIIPRAGGISIFIGLIASLLLTGNIRMLSTEVFIGMLIIFTLGLLDDKYEVSGKVLIFGQLLAAFCIVTAGHTIETLDLGFQTLNFAWNSDLVIHIAHYTYNFIFPADLITVIWIVGLINSINWVGGVDALNISVSSIAGFTLMLIVLDMENPNIGLAALLAAFIGGNIGLLRYNLTPASVFPGSVGDFLNGYLLAVFAVLSNTRWIITIIILSLPIVDSILVISGRLRKYPETRRNPFKLLSISDKSHLHHKLLSLGYSRKKVVLIEISVMIMVCTIAFILSSPKDIYLLLFFVSIIIVSTFTLLTILKRRISN